MYEKVNKKIREILGSEVKSEHSLGLRHVLSAVICGTEYTKEDLMCIISTYSIHCPFVSQQNELFELLAKFLNVK